MNISSKERSSSAQYCPLWGSEERNAIDSIFLSGELSVFSGQYTKLLENLFEESHAGYTAVALSSGTAALHLAMLALEISKGDEVIVPSVTYVATALAPLYVGAQPVFADIRMDSLNLDVDSCERIYSKKTKAVIFVPLFGCSGGLDSIRTFCRERNLLLIEDCAQACGTMVQGKHIGVAGQASCFSFFETKSISVGEGGLLLLRDIEAAKIARSLRHHGIQLRDGKRVVERCGFNYKPSEIQSAIAVAQFKKLSQIRDARQRIRSAIEHKIGNIVQLQQGHRDELVCWDKIAMMLHSEKSRDRVLLDCGTWWVDQYWRRPLQEEPVFGKCKADGETPNANEFIKRHLIFKCSPSYNPDDLKDAVLDLSRSVRASF